MAVELLKHSLWHDSCFPPLFIYSFNIFRKNLKFFIWTGIQTCNSYKKSLIFWVGEVEVLNVHKAEPDWTQWLLCNAISIPSFISGLLTHLFYFLSRMLFTISAFPSPVHIPLGHNLCHSANEVGDGHMVKGHILKPEQSPTCHAPEAMAAKERPNSLL